MFEKAIRLLRTAGILLVIAGCIFGLIDQWIYAALVWVVLLGVALQLLTLRIKREKRRVKTWN